MEELEKKMRQISIKEIFGNKCFDQGSFSSEKALPD